MKASLRTACFGVVMLAGFTATPALACGGSAKLAASWQDSSSPSALFHQADYDNDSDDGIVGMWQFRMLSGGQQADFGFQTWHSDGTEIMNSGGRAPATENFCMGVWRKVGTRHFHLNHFALSYDASSGMLNAKVNIKEDVTLDASGTMYQGTFTLDVYDPKTAALLAHQAGTVIAKRVPSY